jgi:hypothetical protein
VYLYCLIVVVLQEVEVKDHLGIGRICMFQSVADKISKDLQYVRLNELDLVYEVEVVYWGTQLSYV